MGLTSLLKIALNNLNFFLFEINIFKLTFFFFSNSCKVPIKNILFDEDANFKVDVSDESICVIQMNENKSAVHTFYNSTSDEYRQYLKLSCKKSGDIEISVTYNKIPFKNSPLGLRILSQSLSKLFMLSSLKKAGTNLLPDIKATQAIEILVKGEDLRKNSVEL